MAFFFVFDVQPDIKEVAGGVEKPCFNCGSVMKEVRIGHRFRVFFIPVWHSRGHSRLLHCFTCGLTVLLDEYDRYASRWVTLSQTERDRNMNVKENSKGGGAMTVCPTCGARVERGMNYCSNCGSRLYV